MEFIRMLSYFLDFLLLFKSSLYVMNVKTKMAHQKMQKLFPMGSSTNQKPQAIDLYLVDYYSVF